MYENSILKTVNSVIHRHNFAPTLKALTEEEQTFALANAENWLSLDTTNSASFSVGRDTFIRNHLTPDSSSAVPDFLDTVMPMFTEFKLSAAFESYKVKNPNYLQDITVRSKGEVAILERTPDFETFVSKLSLVFNNLSEIKLQSILDFIGHFEKIGLLIMEPFIISIIGVPLYLTAIMLPLHRSGALLKVIKSIKVRHTILKIPIILKNALRRAKMMITQHGSVTSALLTITGTYLLTSLNINLNSTYSSRLALPSIQVRLPEQPRGPEVLENFVDKACTGIEIAGGYAYRVAGSLVKGFVLTAVTEGVDKVDKVVSRGSKD